MFASKSAGKNELQILIYRNVLLHFFKICNSYPFICISGQLYLRFNPCSVTTNSKYSEVYNWILVNINFT